MIDPSQLKICYSYLMQMEMMVLSNILALNDFLPTSLCIILAGPVTDKIGKEQYSDLVSSLQ